MQETILILEEKDKEALASIRCVEGLFAAMDNGYVWVRGINATNLGSRIKQLPVKRTFIIDQQNQLFHPGALTPVEILKELKWLPLQEFIMVETPVAALPGITTKKIEIKIVVSAKERKSTALLTSLSAWKDYADMAPAARLLNLKFAVSENNEVLIIGNPLPPLPGKEYWDTKNILIPCGYDFELNMSPSFINKKWNDDKKSIFLFHTDSKWQRIEKNYFVQGKRSAVRLTKISS